MDRKKQWLIYGMLTFATSTWGSAFIAGKIAIESFEPATISFFAFFWSSFAIVSNYVDNGKGHSKADEKRLGFVCFTRFNRDCNIQHLFLLSE